MESRLWTCIFDIKQNIFLHEIHKNNMLIALIHAPRKLVEIFDIFEILEILEILWLNLLNSSINWFIKHTSKKWTRWRSKLFETVYAFQILNNWFAGCSTNSWAAQLILKWKINICFQIIVCLGDWIGVSKLSFFFSFLFEIRNTQNFILKTKKL